MGVERHAEFSDTRGDLQPKSLFAIGQSRNEQSLWQTLPIISTTTSWKTRLVRALLA